MNTSLFFWGMLPGAIIGWLAGTYFLKYRSELHKRKMRARKAARQRDLYERLRIEVKNNTVRMKKEEKRLALEKKLAPLELLFKNYTKRLHKIADRELMGTLLKFYRNLFELSTINQTFIEFQRKNFQEEGGLSGDAVTQLMHYMTSIVINNLSLNIETGTELVESLEKRIEGE